MTPMDASKVLNFLHVDMYNNAAQTAQVHRLATARGQICVVCRL